MAKNLRGCGVQCTWQENLPRSALGSCVASRNRLNLAGYLVCLGNLTQKANLRSFARTWICFAKLAEP